VFRSIDSGNTWTQIIRGLTVSVTALVLHPRSPAALYAGTLQDGVLRSTDGGDRWTATTPRPAAGNSASGLAIDPVSPSTLYVGTGASVFRTTDSGATWNSVSTGLEGAAGVAALAIDPTTPATIYAISSTTLFRTTDAGAHWAAIATRLGFGPMSLDVFAIDPATPTTLYAGTYSGGFGVYKSTDGGANWLAINQGINAYSMTAIASDPRAQTIYAGTSGGAALHRTQNRAYDLHALVAGRRRRGANQLCARRHRRVRRGVRVHHARRQRSGRSRRVSTDGAGPEPLRYQRRHRAAGGGRALTAGGAALSTTGSVAVVELF
jgi:photosystem II stability/assembly factor-like uncharacterized protein